MNISMAIKRGAFVCVCVLFFFVCVFFALLLDFWLKYFENKSIKEKQNFETHAKCVPRLPCKYFSSRTNLLPKTPVV